MLSFVQENVIPQTTKSTLSNAPWQTIFSTFPTYPCSASGKEPVCQCRRHKEMQVPSLGQEDPHLEGNATSQGRVRCRVFPKYDPMPSLHKKAQIIRER